MAAGSIDAGSGATLPFNQPLRREWLDTVTKNDALPFHPARRL